MTDLRTIESGSIEYLHVTITADVTLGIQPVYLSFDKTTWLSAEWIDAPGTTRRARILLDADTTPAVGRHRVWSKVTDNPEAPIVRAGTIAVR